jgi:hypothetical protein
MANKLQGRETDMAIHSAVHNDATPKDCKKFNAAISRVRMKAVVLSPLGGCADNLPWMLAREKTAAVFKADADALRVPREVRQAIRTAESRLGKKGLDGFDLSAAYTS